MALHNIRLNERSNMQLKEYLAQKNITNKQAAEILNISAFYLGRIANKKIPCSSNLAIQIEKFSEGIVKAQDLINSVACKCPVCGKKTARSKLRNIAERYLMLKNKV